ncbi:MAG: hypothetical protein [Bacteriophage sp.]|nr:MAG: hypothetical protein [Bacteriophage sp.]UWI03246.1 MAG: hypothetical protein [Bacteriophage sp.]
MKTLDILMFILVVVAIKNVNTSNGILDWLILIVAIIWLVLFFVRR